MAVPDTSEFIRQIRYENLGHMDYLVISISPLFIFIGVAVPDTSEFIRQIRYENLGHMEYLVISISPLFIFNWSGCT